MPHSSSSAATAAPGYREAGRRARRRISRRLLPFVFLLSLVAYIDRGNVGYAALRMSADLGFSDAVLGFGAGVFFVGYVLLEIPGTLIVERWSARRWMARIMISWGVVTVLTGFVHTAGQFYWARFLLGVAEAGFFPGILVYLTHWFRYEDRAQAMALFIASIPLSYFAGSPVAGLVLGVHWLGLAGWRWLFILEGVPAVALGIVTLFYLTDRPEEAQWLPAEERDWITAALEAEKQQKHAIRRYSVLEGLKNPLTLQLVAIYFFIQTGLWAFNLWLPTVIKRASGLSDLKTTLLAGAPFLAGTAIMMLNGRHSDRRRERIWHTAIPLLVISVSLFLATALSAKVWMSIALLMIGGFFLYSHYPCFWSIPGTFLTESSAAGAIGLINCMGNLGGFVGPYLVGYLATRTGSFRPGLAALAGSYGLAAALVIGLRHQARVERSS